MIQPKTPFNLGGSSVIRRRAHHDKMTTLLGTCLVRSSFVDCLLNYLLSYLFC